MRSVWPAVVPAVNISPVISASLGVVPKNLVGPSSVSRSESKNSGAFCVRSKDSAIVPIKSKCTAVVPIKPECSAIFSLRSGWTAVVNISPVSSASLGVPKKLVGPNSISRTECFNGPSIVSRFNERPYDPGGNEPENFLERNHLSYDEQICYCMW